MKKINIFLAAVLCIMIAAILYFHLGTRLDVQPSAYSDDGKVRCEVILSNGSLLPMECIEFTAIHPTGAYISDSAGEGEDIPPLSRREMSFTVSAEDPSGAQVEIGYYVLGTRKTVTVTLR